MADTGFVVGVDGGGTSTRAVAMSVDPGNAGSLLGSGHSGGANPNSHPPEEAAAHVAEAVLAAITDLDPARARAGVLGMAGDSKLTDPRIADVFSAAWRSTGLGHEPIVLSDAEAAFASATSAPDGTALVAGTGAIAARIADHRLVRTACGHGWLLGDEGSAFWIGREAVRSTLRALDGATPLSPLGHAVLAEAGIASDGDAAVTFVTARDTAHRLITVVNADSPVHLARFAPAVTGAAANGDTAAARILDDAAAELAATAMAAREHGEATPVVLIGGLVDPGGPLAARVRTELSPRCAGQILLAGEAAEAGTMTAGAAGAAWLAALTVLGPFAPRPSH